MKAQNLKVNNFPKFYKFKKRIFDEDPGFEKEVLISEFIHF